MLKNKKLRTKCPTGLYPFIPSMHCILFGICLFVFSFSFVHNSLGKTGATHSQDMIEVLLGDKSTNAKELRITCQTISATIDNFEAIKGLPVGSEGHRVYGHWGLFSRIPFTKEPLKGVLDSVYDKAIKDGKTIEESNAIRKAAKDKIINSWQKDQKKIIKLVANELGYTFNEKTGKVFNGKVDVTRQVKGLAGLFYDIHLLGDYGGVKLGALQNIDSLGRDVGKNLYRLLGNNSHLAKQLSEEINKAMKLCKTNTCKADNAKAILNILKNSEELRQVLAVNLAHKYPITSRIIASKPLYKSALSIAVVSSQYSKLLSKVPKKLRSPIQGGLVAGLISTGINGYQVIEGEMNPFDAATQVAEDSSLAAGSIYISDAILTKVGDKYALQAITNSTDKVLCKAFGTAVNLGIATFVFDESRVIYNFCKGNISQEEFITKSGEAVIRTGGSFAATYCAVAIGFGPAGPAVMFISVGGYIFADMGINKYKQLEARGHLTLDDILIKVPFDIRDKPTIYDLPHMKKLTLFDLESQDKDNLFEMEKIDKDTIFNMEEIKKPTLFD